MIEPSTLVPDAISTRLRRAYGFDEVALVPGAILHVARDFYVVIEAASEPVLAVTPRSRDEALRVAFEVGNRHFTLAIDGDRVLVPDDPAMEQLLGRLEVPWQRERAVFAPLATGHRHD